METVGNDKTRRLDELAAELPELSTGSEWMHLSVHAPSGVVQAVMAMLRQRYGFRDITGIDWCVLEREQDFAHVDYAPADEATNLYAIDWRAGADRGDVTIRLENM